MIILLLSCTGPTDSALFAEATQAITGDLALQLCRDIEDPALSDECVAGSVRARPELAAECGSLSDPRWAGECWFSVAESHAPDRWRALESCAQAGPYLQECLYHLWTAELSQALESSAGPIEAVPAGQEIVDYWSGAEHLVVEPDRQLWRDFWFFAIRHHGPADLEWCTSIPAELAPSCRDGLQAGVQRALVDLLSDAATPEATADRTCRSGLFGVDLLEPVMLPQPELIAASAHAAELACSLARGEPVRRWNPVFREAGS